MDYIVAAYLSKLRESPNELAHSVSVPHTAFDFAALIIDILTQGTNKIRQKIKITFEREYKCDIMNDLKCELGEQFVDIINTLMMPPVEFLCKQLHSAMDGKDTNKETLVEILCLKTNEEMLEIVAAYEKKYDCPLIEQICSETSGHLRRLLNLVVTGVRDPNNKVNTDDAKEQAAALYTAGKGVDKEVLFRLMSLASFAQLRLVFDEYKQLSGHTIEQAIEHEMDNELHDAMMVIVEYVQSPVVFFANRLYRAMDNAETDDATLIRIFVSRSEIDLDRIQIEFERIYNRTLLSAIESETSGIHKHILTGLLSGSKWFKYMT